MYGRFGFHPYVLLWFSAFSLFRWFRSYFGRFLLGGFEGVSSRFLLKDSHISTWWLFSWWSSIKNSWERYLIFVYLVEPEMRCSWQLTFNFSWLWAIWGESFELEVAHEVIHLPQGFVSIRRVVREIDRKEVFYSRALFISNCPDLTGLTGALDRFDRCFISVGFSSDFAPGVLVLFRDSCCSSLVQFGSL
jgi:hypothetical protein